VNGDVHGGHASCGSATRASRFLIGLVTCFAMRDRISAVARAAWRQQMLGGIPGLSELGLELADLVHPVLELGVGRVLAMPGRRHGTSSRSPYPPPRPPGGLPG
jgi:hypothetical protein